MEVEVVMVMVMVEVEAVEVVGVVVVRPPARAGWLSMSAGEESGQNACRVMGYGLG